MHILCEVRKDAVYNRKTSFEFRDVVEDEMESFVSYECKVRHRIGLTGDSSRDSNPQILKSVRALDCHTATEFSAQIPKRFQTMVAYVSPTGD